MRRFALLALVSLLTVPFALAGTVASVPDTAPEAAPESPSPELPAAEAPASELEIAEVPDRTPAESLDELRDLADPNQDGLFRALRECQTAAEFAQCPSHCTACIVSNNIVYCAGC